MAPKSEQNTGQRNTGSPKASNRYGDGALNSSLKFRDPILVGRRFQVEVGQRRYSTETGARTEMASAKSTSNLVKLDNNKFTGLYKTIADINTLKIAYSNIKSKPGNMTTGLDEETLDGVSEKFLLELEALLKEGSFQFKPARRVHIPKANGKKRPLAIASPRDKIVQEAMRMVLEAVFEPLFSNLSHGFRPNRGCHTALREVSK